MEREAAIQEIRKNWRRVIVYFGDGHAKELANGEVSWVCPIPGCNHGAESGAGLTYNPQSRDKNSLICFKCGFSGDIIDLAQKAFRMDYNEALDYCAELLGITIDSPLSISKENRRGSNPSEALKNADKGESLANPHDVEENAKLPPSDAPEAALDLTAYYAECSRRLDAPEAAGYLKSRGISPSTAQAYQLGFDPEADPAGSGIKSPRIIIPTSRSHYIARAVSDSVKKQFRKMNNKGGKAAIFNNAAIDAPEVKEVFVTEGAFDALSVLEAGCTAIAINSVANARHLVEELTTRGSGKTFILCLDNDAPGKNAEETIRTGLKALNISCITADICGGYKDPNEHLQKDRIAFFDAVQTAKTQDAARPDNISHYINAYMDKDISQFKTDIFTGFQNLDRQCGGLYSGLYVVAAISSLGKTTFVHQIADSVAAGGHDVLYFSLEQSRLELASKSIARTLAKAKGNHEQDERPVTSFSIRRGYNSQETQAAREDYMHRVGKRLSVIEGNFSCNISFISNYAREYIERTGARPVIIVDYLQILQPEAVKGRTQTTKEIVDLTISNLKRISREYNLPIIAVCSVNRANYMTPIDFESLKESGNIEFTADVIWGLQLHCITADDVFDAPKEKKISEKRKTIQEAKAATPRQVDLVCLKNRFGISSYVCSFKYYPAIDLFVPEAMPFPEHGEDLPRIGR